MNLKIVRRIRDNLHGSIDISELEDRVLEHDLIQRLRRVRQTSFLSFVFPGASHSRFEHSLGVLHLAGVAWTKLHHNQQRLYQSVRDFPDFERREREPSMIHGTLFPCFRNVDQIFGSSYVLQALRLAALCHDLGHPPFSHSGERFLPTWTEVLMANPSLPAYLKEYLQHRIEECRAKGRDPAKVQVRHEIYTLLAIDKVLTDTYSRDPNLSLVVAPQDVASILDPTIPPQKGSDLNFQGLNVLCHELVSAEFDVDRMDYLLRDSRECGVVYGIFDNHRILDSLALYAAPDTGNIHLAINFSGLAAFEDYLRARLSMYLQLYFHKTSVAAEAMMQFVGRSLGDWRLPANLDRYKTLDEYSIGPLLIGACDEILGNTPLRDQVARTIENLMYNRRFWKRVYEVSNSTHGGESMESIEVAKSTLTKLGITFEQVDSRGSLTSFKPRSHDEPSSNYLRLIKKDHRQFPRVVPIEDFSSIIHDRAVTNIARLYVEDAIEGSQASVEAARKALMTVLYS